jgi:hypothetical protein
MKAVLRRVLSNQQIFRLRALRGGMRSATVSLWSATCRLLPERRQGMGLAPKYYDMLLGRRVNRDVKKGTPMGWGLVG